MTEQAILGMLGVLAVLLGYQQFRIYRLRVSAKHRDELFKIVTENAADMIALVDMKGRRLYNTPTYKRSWPTPPQSCRKLPRSSRSIPTTDSRSSRRLEKREVAELARGWNT